jgi:hypothetical protein
MAIPICVLTCDFNFRSQIANRKSQIQLSLFDLYELSLLIAKGETVASQTKFDRITKRRPTNDFNFGPVAEAHLKKAPA